MNSPKELPQQATFDTTSVLPFGVRTEEEFALWNTVDSRKIVEQKARELEKLSKTTEYAKFVSRVRKREFWAVDVTRGIGATLISLEREIMRARIRVNLMSLKIRLERNGLSLNETHRAILSPGQVGDSFGNPLHLATIIQSDLDYYNSFFGSLL